MKQSFFIKKADSKLKQIEKRRKALDEEESSQKSAVEKFESDFITAFGEKATDLAKKQKVLEATLEEEELEQQSGVNKLESEFKKLIENKRAILKLNLLKLFLILMKFI